MMRKIELELLLQFWATATIKKVNNVVQLRALIDGKKVVVVSEDVIRRDLHLDDADGCLSAKRTAWNEFSCSMASVVICLATVVMDNQVDDLTSHNTRYTSIALTQKVFANMRRVGKVPIAPAPSPPPQDPTPKPHATPPQAQHSTPHASPPQEHPTTTSESSMSLLNTLQETCATLSQKVAKLEQDEHSQALEILQLKKRVKSKDVSATEPAVFDDEEVRMTMAQTLIKLKAEIAKLLNEQIAQKLHDEEVKKLQPGISKKRMI
nr:hypothetical protein [Tanacetum cinerariifolium]